jgi:hypothetical protein
MESRAELGIEPPVIAKIAQPELAQMHGEWWDKVTKMGSDEKSTVSYLTL